MFLGTNSSISLLLKTRETCPSIAPGQKILDSPFFQRWINLLDSLTGFNHFEFFLTAQVWLAVGGNLLIFSRSHFNSDAAVPSQIIESSHILISFYLLLIWSSQKAAPGDVLLVPFWLERGSSSAIYREGVFRRNRLVILTLLDQSKYTTYDYRSWVKTLVGWLRCEAPLRCPAGMMLKLKFDSDTICMVLEWFWLDAIEFRLGHNL